MFRRLKTWAGLLKREVLVVWLAARDPRVPWAAKVLAALAAAYALSPIDLIPDFVPVLGYLDDLILLPVMIWLALRFDSARDRRRIAGRSARRVSPKPRRKAARAQQPS